MKFLHKLLPAGLPISILAILAYALHHEFTTLAFKDVTRSVRSLDSSQLAWALLLTAASYATLTNYDRLALRYVGHPIALPRTWAISFSAFAIGHNVGVAALSGGAIRARAYSMEGLSAIDIGKIIVFGSITFFVGGSLLLGVALLFEPTALLASLGIPTVPIHALTLMLILFPVAYLGAAFTVRKPIIFRGQQFALPPPSIAAQQLLVASIDLVFAASVIYTLLPPDSETTYPLAVSAYLIATLLGVASGVPGGLGVFEGMMLLMLPAVHRESLLAAILVYRVIYYVIPLFLALTLLTREEIARREALFSSILHRGRNWVATLAPPAAGIFVLLAGTVLIISGSLPGEASRLHFLSDFIPLTLLEASHLLNSAIGVALLFVARGLFLRLRMAYAIALALLVAGALVSLGKGLDAEESALQLLALLTLWIFRREFYRASSMLDLRFPVTWLLSVFGILMASAWIGMIAYRHVEYSHELWWRFALDADAPRMLRGTLVGALVLISFALANLLRAKPPPVSLPDKKDLEAVRSITAASDSSLANVALLGDKRFLFHPSNRAFIMYQVSRNSWIALGDPVGPEDCHEDLAWAFRETAHRYGDRCAFYEVGESSLPLYIDMGLSLIKLGEEAVVNLAEFSLEGSKRADLRQARNRSLRQGASFEVVPAASVPSILPELRVVSDEWLGNKRAAEKGFSLGRFEEAYLANFPCGVVRREGQIVAFANLWTSHAGGEASVDLMRYGEGAPRGIMDYLFVESMLWAKSMGYGAFSLGMAPLSGMNTHPLSPLWQKIGNTIFLLGEDFYNFEGLRLYKNKFDPDWKPRYLATPGGLAAPRILLDAAILIAGGAQKLLAKG